MAEWVPRIPSNTVRGRVAQRHAKRADATLDQRMSLLHVQTGVWDLRNGVIPIWQPRCIASASLTPAQDPRQQHSQCRSQRRCRPDQDRLLRATGSIGRNVRYRFLQGKAALAALGVSADVLAQRRLALQSRSNLTRSILRGRRGAGSRTPLIHIVPMGTQATHWSARLRASCRDNPQSINVRPLSHRLGLRQVS